MERLATSSPVTEPSSRELGPFGDVFRIAFDQSAIGISVSALSGEYVHVNRAFCDFLGYTGDELRALRIGDLMPPEDLARVNQVKEQLLRGEATETRSERRYIHKSGRTLWALLTN